jgi:hypothetical protein
MLTCTKSFTASPPRIIRGQFLCKNRWSKRARAQLAADILAGRAMVIDLTAKQLAGLCRVSLPYIAEAREPDRAAARLLRDWEDADADQRVAFARRAGIELIFDTRPAIARGPTLCHCERLVILVNFLPLAQPAHSRPKLDALPISKCCAFAQSPHQTALPFPLES